MNSYLQRPRPLIVISVILGALLLSIVVFFGASQTTRGPIEILLALLLGSLVLLVRAYTRRTR